MLITLSPNSIASGANPRHSVAPFVSTPESRKKISIVAVFFQPPIFITTGAGAPLESISVAKHALRACNLIGLIFSDFKKVLSDTA